MTFPFLFLGVLVPSIPSLLSYQLRGRKQWDCTSEQASDLLVTSRIPLRPGH